MKKKFRSFKEARKFVHKLKLKNATDWSNYCKSGKRPQDIPTRPDKIYKNKGWVNWKDWVGTDYVNYHEACKYAQKLNIQKKDEWKKHTKIKKFPKNIPKDPQDFYKLRGTWETWGDFLGTGRIAPKNRIFLSFYDARRIVHSWKIKNRNEWNILVQKKNFPSNIPHLPWEVYKGKFKDLGDWLGTGTVAPQNMEFRFFEDARKFVQRLGLKKREEWVKYCKSGNKPDYIPSLPSRTYKKEWKGWGDWLGTGRIANQTLSQNWLPWRKAKPLYQKIVKENKILNQTEWIEYIKTHKLPNGLPPYPNDIYAEERVRKMMK